MLFMSTLSLLSVVICILMLIVCIGKLPRVTFGLNFQSEKTYCAAYCASLLAGSGDAGCNGGETVIRAARMSLG